jgi:riboflavin biosynthesis pyrimidine reductase
MIELEPLETLYETDHGAELPLPLELATVYGHLSFPAHPGRAHVISNFVTTLDGVVSLGVPGKEGGGEISGNNQHDRLVMGLLRAVSDAVIVGAGTLRGSPRHLWTAGYIFPSLADTFRKLRTNLGKLESPLNVIVTSSGGIDPSLPVFQSGKVPVLIVTTASGAKRISQASFPSSIRVQTVTSEGSLCASEILHEVMVGLNVKPDRILVEGGPQLMGVFYADQALDEQFLTLAPQVAGRDDPAKRPGLVAGTSLAPESPTWGTLLGVKRAASHLFLRYGFKTKDI